MAAVRDPAFWKRFSKAVHLDEEASSASTQPTISSPSSHLELKHSESWLDRQHKKRRRNYYTMCLFSLLFVLVVALVVVVLVWLSRHGWFMNGERVTFP
ncbi:hypothetical protein MMC24_006246 [Lignoscripta atroalba]|nr:hypothetical protein [Lignoscripta atroalba]